MTISDQRHCEVLLSVQRALLGEITPNLRAVTVRYDATSIKLQAFYDGEVGEDEREAMALVETEVMAEFPSTHTVSCEVVRLDSPSLVPKDRDWAYYRKED